MNERYGEERGPALNVGIPLSNGWICNEPPDDKAVGVQWVPWWDPQHIFEEEGVDLHNEDDDHQSNGLYESNGARKKIPLILVPVGRCELT